MLGLESLLRARLEEIPGFAGVYGAPELAEAGAARRLPPCAFVIWNGYLVKETTVSKRATRVDSRWHVVVAVKNASDPADGSPARADASPLLQAVLGKLLGWIPAPGYGPLALADDAPRPTYRGGVLRFPIAVTSEVVVKGD